MVSKLRYFGHTNELALLTFGVSPVAHHIPTATGCRSKQGCAADVHPRATEHARENNKVWPQGSTRGNRRANYYDSFMCHPEMLLPIPKIDDPVERFVSVVKFYLSGWHIRPPYGSQTSLVSRVSGR